MLKNLFLYLNGLVNDERGQGMVEYALIIAFIALIVLAGVTGLGGKVLEIFNNITNSF